VNKSKSMLVGILGMSLLLVGASCEKSNPVKTTPITPVIITPSGTMTDIDGNVYQTVKIGTQVWTVENLQTTKYNDGTAITLVTSTVTWDSLYAHHLTTPVYCYYNNMTNADSIKKWGALYNWYVVNTGKLAPAGWHVPTDSEWEVMQSYLVMNGYNYDGTTDTTTMNKISKALAAQTDWATSTNAGVPGNNLTQNNQSGFSALPGGFRDIDGSFGNVGSIGIWWCASELNASLAWNRGLVCDSYDLDRNYTHGKNCGFSVRLVRD